MERITILGASGHGKVVADIAKLCGYEEIEFLDDDETVKYCGLYPVVGKCKDALQKENTIFVAIGDFVYRKQYLKMLEHKKIPVLIHPSAIIAADVEIGFGTVVMAGTVINSGSRIGCGCIINTCSSVDHDCVIGDYAHIAVGSHLCGTVTVGDETWIGAGVTVSNNINICGQCIIGAGAVVIDDITVPETYVGIPAKRLERVR